MRQIIYTEKDLPMQDLEELNLAVKGQVLLNAADLSALLAGGRTGMLKFQNLENENMKIESLDGKLSLQTGEEGKLKLQIHPVYNKPEAPDFLDESEAKQLEKGEVPNLLKTITDNDGNKKELLVEYDAETREFIVSDTELIIAPDKVNDEKLSEGQRSRYRKGKEVELFDGTVFQYAAKEPTGVISNKVALIASLFLDGGLSFMVMKALSPLFGKKHEPEEANNLSPGYYNAMRDSEKQKPVFNQHSKEPAQSRKR